MAIPVRRPAGNLRARTLDRMAAPHRAAAAAPLHLGGLLDTPGSGRPRESTALRRALSRARSAQDGRQPAEAGGLVKFPGEDETEAAAGDRHSFTRATDG